MRLEWSHVTHGSNWRKVRLSTCARRCCQEFTPPPNRYASPNRGGGTCTEDQESPSPQAGRGLGWGKTVRPFSLADNAVECVIPTQFVSRCSLHATVQYWAALCICVHTFRHYVKSMVPIVPSFRAQKDKGGQLKAHPHLGSNVQPLVSLPS